MRNVRIALRDMELSQFTSFYPPNEPRGETRLQILYGRLRKSIDNLYALPCVTQADVMPETSRNPGIRQQADVAATEQLEHGSPRTGRGSHRAQFKYGARYQRCLNASSAEHTRKFLTGQEYLTFSGSDRNMVMCEFRSIFMLLNCTVPYSLIVPLYEWADSLR
ncbi:uncharacterized protein BJX67DRAFT_349450 [Aspergillus lucknowensis]|uniref:Uncharacterized protein n=1 Tax=Aspergillus lucknowensis TaxID=176173 RepID=A0ABR4LWI1_9EURO